MTLPVQGLLLISLWITGHHSAIRIESTAGQDAKFAVRFTIESRRVS